MINFRVTDIQGGLLTIERPAGQAISLKLAEIVRAQVMEILPSGAIALKIKGEPIIAKTQVPLQPGTNPYFKVTNLPTEGKDLTLQFLGFASDEEPQPSQQTIFSDARKDYLTGLMRELSNLLRQIKEYSSEQPAKTSRLQTLSNEILKLLPQDIQRLPKEMRLQLQDLLQTSIKITGQGIQSRLSELINNLPKNDNLTDEIANLKREISVSIERLSNISLKGAIQDTGVALEAKIKSVAVSQDKLIENLLKGSDTKIPDKSTDQTMQTLKPKTQSAESDLQQLRYDKFTDAKSLIQNDLKARLLQLKDAINRGGIGETITRAEVNKPELSQPYKNTEQLTSKVDALLKDIETFQTLSKATNSFYTFLPVDWKGLKDGDIAFKKGKARESGITPYSCNINLNLDRVGAVGFIVLKFGNDYYLSIRTEDKKFQDELKTDIQELKNNFAQKGMRLNSINFFDFDDVDTFEQIDRIISDENGGLNIKA